MRIKILKAGNYAGPTAGYPQVETSEDDTVIDVEAVVAECYIDRGWAFLHEEKGEVPEVILQRGKRRNPAKRDKGRAEVE